jgi:hypothetical protein
MAKAEKGTGGAFVNVIAYKADHVRAATSAVEAGPPLLRSIRTQPCPSLIIDRNESE